MGIDDLKLSIYESAMNGLIEQETAYGMLDVLQEGVLSNPLKKKLEKIKEIKDMKPKDYDGPEEAKKFIDKNYDDIIKVAKILEKEPADIQASDFKTGVASLVSIIGGYAAVFVGAATDSFIVMGSGGVALILGVILTFAYEFIKYLRVTTDIKASNDLSKIRTALKKIDIKALPKEYKDKVSDIVTSIDDAETEISRRIKVTKESVDMKLKVYDACLAGEITESQRDELLDKITVLTESAFDAVEETFFDMCNKRNPKMKDCYHSMIPHYGHPNKATDVVAICDKAIADEKFVIDRGETHQQAVPIIKAIKSWFNSHGTEDEDKAYKNLSKQEVKPYGKHYDPTFSNSATHARDQKKKEETERQRQNRMNNLRDKAKK